MKLWYFKIFQINKAYLKLILIVISESNWFHKIKFKLEQKSLVQLYLDVRGVVGLRGPVYATN